MIIYFTVAEQPSGIYSGQVIDICRHIQIIANKEVKLVALVSIRGFWNSRRIIKKQYGNSIVMPMAPKLRNWRFNLIQLFFVAARYRPSAIISRNAIPTVIAMSLRRVGFVKKVIYDGRGAEYEQIREYGVIENPRLANQILECERKAINDSDYQIAVSSSLVDYWRSHFNYSKDTFTILPCTLDSCHEREDVDSISREELGYSEGDIIIVFLGSSSGWQSFDLMRCFLTEQLRRNTFVKVQFLSRPNVEIEGLAAEFPGRVRSRWCVQSEVRSYLAIGDYGLLIREDSVTNRVSAPVKFAEYLNAGLQLVISEGIGDFSQFVLAHSCGVIYSGEYVELNDVSIRMKELSKELAARYFSKRSEVVVSKLKNVLKDVD